jgi:large subunit ribosomal protein L21
MYAIISYKGRQHRIEPDMVLDVDRVSAEPGDSVKLEDAVLLVNDGLELKTGTPTVEGVNVELEVVEHYRAKKIISFKMKRRKGYRRKKGHRQEMTRVRVKDIKLG